MQEGRKFYEDLYRGREEDETPLQDLDEEIDQLNLPQLSQEGRLALDAPLTQEELRSALGELNHGKSPGTDGIPPEFYLKFWPSLAPYLLRSFESSIQMGLLSQEQRRGGHHSSPQEGGR